MELMQSTAPKLRQQPAALLQVSFVLDAEFFHHHSLLFAHALEIENRKREQPRKARAAMTKSHSDKYIG